MAADIASTEFVDFACNRRFDAAADDVDQGFVRMDVNRGTCAGLIVKFQQGHLIASDKWLEDETASHRFVFDRSDNQARDVGVFRNVHQLSPTRREWRQTVTW